MSIFGITICESPFPLERQVPNRIHKKRKNQSAAYHIRVQKKWAKRFGMHTERFALMVNPKAAGLFGDSFLSIDPRDAVLLRNYI